MTQSRLPFSDYSAEQQERDAKRAEQLKKTDVYVSRVDGRWNAIVPRKHNIVINGKYGEELTDFVTNVKQDLKEFGIDASFRCVRNYGLDAHFRHNQQILKRFNER